MLRCVIVQSRTDMAHAKIDVLSLSSPEAVCNIGGCGLTWCQTETDRSWRGVAIRGDHKDFILFEAESHVLSVSCHTITNDVRLRRQKAEGCRRGLRLGRRRTRVRR